MQQLIQYISETIKLFSSSLKEGIENIKESLFDKLWIDILAFFVISIIALLPDFLAELPNYPTFELTYLVSYFRFDSYKGLGIGFYLVLIWIYGRYLSRIKNKSEIDTDTKLNTTPVAFLFLFTAILTSLIYKLNSLRHEPEGLSGLLQEMQMPNNVMFQLMGFWSLISCLAGYFALLNLINVNIKKIRFLNHLVFFSAIILFFNLSSVLISNISYYAMQPLSALIGFLLGQNSYIAGFIFFILFGLFALIVFKLLCILTFTLVQNIKKKITQDSIQNIP